MFGKFADSSVFLGKFALFGKSSSHIITNVEQQTLACVGRSRASDVSFMQNPHRMYRERVKIGRNQETHVCGV